MKGDFSRNVDTSKKVKVEKKVSREWTVYRNVFELEFDTVFQNNVDMNNVHIKTYIWCHAVAKTENNHFLESGKNLNLIID